MDNSISGILYGCVVLHTVRDSYTPVTFPFTELPKVEKGNHFGPLREDLELPFDYWLGGSGLEVSKLSAPSRGVTIGGMRVGEHSEDNLTHKIIYNLLTINSDSTADDRTLPYLDLVYSKVSKNIKGRLYATFDINSSKSKFVIMSKEIPVYLFTFSDDEAAYLIWSNEESLRHRMRQLYGEDFYYYNLGTLLNGTLVLQSYYLRKIYQKWRKLLRDRLKIMNALEEYINKKTLRDTEDMTT
jgi:hypothetical protein